MIGWRRTLGRAAPGLLTLGLAVIAAGVLTLAGERYSTRVDVTASGSQRLADRTRSLIEQVSLLGESELVIVVDVGTIDPRARRLVRDVLDLCADAGSVRTSEIDAGSGSGQREFAELVGRLVERDRDVVEQHARTLESAAYAVEDASDRLGVELATAIDEMTEALRSPELRQIAGACEQWAAVLRLRAQTLRSVSTAAHAAVAGEDGGGPLPPFREREREMASAIEACTSELEALGVDMQEIARMPQVASGVASRARAVRDGAASIRDELARRADEIDRLPVVDVFRVADALSGSELALLIGPPGTGIAGIDISALYEPTVLAADGARFVGDVRAHAEELIASSFSSILMTNNPIVVLVHGEAADPLETSGFFDGVRERLAERGIDMVSWAAAADSEPPDLSELDPDGIRPSVYVTLSPDSSSTARSESELPGPEKAAALGRAVARILERGDSLLLNVNPSILPAYGEPDPVVQPLESLGVFVETHAPLLFERVSTQGRAVFTDRQALPRAGEHPVSGAISSLPTLLPWPIPIRFEPMPGVDVTELISIRADGRSWTESQWLRYWQTPRAQRAVLPDQPSFDAGTDSQTGPWPVAIAVETRRGSRVVVVGSNGWFADPAAFEYRSTDGRLSLVSPGNAELFEAAVLYLAGMEGSIARSATAGSAPLIQPMAPARLSALRWAMVVGLPLGTLLLGIVWRVARG